MTEGNLQERSSPALRPEKGSAGDVSGGLVPAVYVAAGLSLASALVYLWSIPAHYLLWSGYGAFFLAAALGQGLLGVALLRWPGAPVTLAGIAGNLTLVCISLVWYSDGIPFGPHAGMVMDVGRLEVTASAAQLGVVLFLLTLLETRYRRWTVNILFALGIGIWALRLLGVISFS